MAFSMVANVTPPARSFSAEFSISLAQLWYCRTQACLNEGENSCFEGTVSIVVAPLASMMLFGTFFF
jgi:hypothetical protein